MLSCNRKKCIKDECDYWNKREKCCHQANLISCPICHCNKLPTVVRTCAEGVYFCETCSIWYSTEGKIVNCKFWGGLSIAKYIFGKRKGRKTEISRR